MGFGGPTKHRLPISTTSTYRILVDLGRSDHLAGHAGRRAFTVSNLGPFWTGMGYAHPTARSDIAAWSAPGKKVPSWMKKNTHSFPRTEGAKSADFWIIAVLTSGGAGACSTGWIELLETPNKL